MKQVKSVERLCPWRLNLECGDSVTVWLADGEEPPKSASCLGPNCTMEMMKTQIATVTEAFGSPAVVRGNGTFLDARGITGPVGKATTEVKK